MEWLFNCLVMFLVVAAFLGIGIFLLSRVDPNNDPDEKHSPYILQYGQKARAMIVMPPPHLYAEAWPEAMTSAQVVFIKEPAPPNVDQLLQQIGTKLLTFQAAPQASKAETIIENVFKSEIPYFNPLRIPNRITGNIEAYTIAVKMRKATWPEGWTPEPFFDIKVVFEEPNAGARRVNHVIPEKYRVASK